MKIKILRATVADGSDVFPGETHDVSTDTASLLIAMGKASLVAEGKPAAPVIETAEAAPAVERAEAPHAKKKK
jgi:hypothetical protein